MRRPFDTSYWFGHKQNKSYQIFKLNEVFENNHVVKAIKDGKKNPTTKQLSLMSFVVSVTKKQRIIEPETELTNTSTESGLKSTTLKQSAQSYSIPNHSVSSCEGLIYNVRQKAIRK
mmetsp:Transcript_32323/g.64023  ORF Transcript_32323/g.64023 Transcript_32323/m.64023 type:complete len:117 (-) Transcript_32323:77-427(-)